MISFLFMILIYFVCSSKNDLISRDSDFHVCITISGVRLCDTSSGYLRSPANVT